MEVLDNVDFEKGFLCHKCRFPLRRNEESDRGGHEQSTRLNAQFRFITGLLPKIDQVVIPDNTFEVALASAKPVKRDALLNPANETVPTDLASSRPTAVRGMANTGPTSIAVTLTASEGPTDADKAAEKARKEAVAAQNQLPSHFTHSTITGERVVHPAGGSLFKEESFGDSKDTKDTKITTPSFSESAEIDNYFAQLKAEQAREAVIEQEEEFETDDDDEDEEGEDLGFEDVVPGGTSGVGTPASSASNETKSMAGGLASALKKAGSVGPSSNGGTSTGAPSPGTGPQTPDSGRAIKRVRIEEPALGVPIFKDEEESEEDVEFEDV